MTVKEMSRRIGLSATRIKQLINEGKIAATKIGRFWDITEEEYDRFAKLDRPAGHPTWVRNQQREEERQRSSKRQSIRTIGMQ